MKTVSVNGQPVPSEVIEFLFKEVQSRKFRYIEKSQTAKTEGTRQANLKKVHLLDEYMTLLSYATGVPFEVPRRAYR
jgi:hypothetical protein